MAQLHLYLPDDIADAVKDRAAAGGLSVSAYLADLVRSQMADEWPEDFFAAVVGGWQGDPLERPKELPLDRRKRIDVPPRRERVHRNHK